MSQKLKLFDEQNNITYLSRQRRSTQIQSTRGGGAMALRFRLKVFPHVICLLWSCPRQDGASDMINSTALWENLDPSILELFTLADDHR